MGIDRRRDMISLQDIDVSLARAEALVRADISHEAESEVLTCLLNARQMLQELGHEATASLERMSDTLASLSDISKR